MTCSSGATRARRRLVFRRPWNIFTGVLWVGPFVFVAGVGLLTVVLGIMDAVGGDPDGEWFKEASRIIDAAIQVLAAVRVVNDYWLPRWFEIVLEDGKPIRPDGFWELLFAAMPPIVLTLAVVVPVIDGYPLPEGREWLLYSGAFLIIVPTALHRAIERKRFPDMRVGNSVMP